jgi:hypothetical protein
MLRTTVIAIFMILLVAGCSSGQLPTSPAPGELQNPGLAGAVNGVQGDRVIWGLWSFAIDLEKNTIEALPLRTAEFHFNVSLIVDGPPANLLIGNFVNDKPGHVIHMDVSLTHPFPGKPNLTGFDVRGIVMGPGGLKGWSDPSLAVATPTETHIVTPDGYTRWWNPVEFGNDDDMLHYRDGRFAVPNTGLYTATLNGFMYFADDLEVNDKVDVLLNYLDNRAVFTSASTNTRHYDIWFDTYLDPNDGNKEKKHLFFNYAVDASWAKIPGYQQGDPVDVPSDFPPEANMTEPFLVQVFPELVDLFYESPTKKGGTAVFNVRVYDWQGYLTMDDVANQIGEIRFESPTCLDTYFTGTVTDPGSGSKAYAEYEVVVDGSHLTANTNSGDHLALVTVVSANGDYQTAYTDYSGTAPLSSYAFTTISNIVPTAKPPTAAATADKTDIYTGEFAHFDATASHANITGETITDYSWDFDSAGGSSYGDAFDSGTSQMPVKQFLTEGTYVVDLQVTDSLGSTDNLKAPTDETITVTVTEPPCAPPVAQAVADKTVVVVDEEACFDASSSYDTDGTIVKYEWDLDADGAYDDGSGINICKSWPAVGEYTVDLKVTDDCEPDAMTDTLDVPITVFVTEEGNECPEALAEVVGDSFWADDAVEFDGTASFDPDGTIAEYQWDFSDDGTGDYDDATGPNPSHIFGPGTYQIDLRVIDDKGCPDALDEPISIFVDSHVVIEIEEDNAYKSVDGYEYKVLACATPDMIPIDYMSNHGPWDFNGPTYLPDPDYLSILPPTDPEVSPYIPDFFPSTTDYFLKYSLVGAGVDGWIFLGEEPDYTNDILSIHGHIEKKKDSPNVGIVSYNEETCGPVQLQYPWTISTDQTWVISYKGGLPAFIEMTYHEIGIGEGYTSGPFPAGVDPKALLTRTNWQAKLNGEVILRAILYKWSSDDGRQVARLYAVNTPIETNFDPYTYEITGVSRLTVLSKIL